MSVKNTFNINIVGYQINIKTMGIKRINNKPHKAARKSK